MTSCNPCKIIPTDDLTELTFAKLQILPILLDHGTAISLHDLTVEWDKRIPNASPITESRVVDIVQSAPHFLRLNSSDDNQDFPLITCSNEPNVNNDEVQMLSPTNSLKVQPISYTPEVKSSICSVARAYDMTSHVQKTQNSSTTSPTSGYRTTALVAPSTSIHADTANPQPTLNLEAFTLIQICDRYTARKAACHKQNCPHLHVCKWYILGTCVAGTSGGGCPHRHRLRSRHNQSVLRRHGLHDMRTRDIRRLLRACRTRSTLPQACVYYNTKDKCRTEKVGGLFTECCYLHVCCYWLQDACRFATNKCRRLHSLEYDQPRRALARFGISVIPSGKESGLMTGLGQVKMTAKRVHQLLRDTGVGKTERDQEDLLFLELLKCKRLPTLGSAEYMKASTHASRDMTLIQGDEQKSQIVSSMLDSACYENCDSEDDSDREDSTLKGYSHDRTTLSITQPAVIPPFLSASANSRFLFPATHPFLHQKPPSVNNSIFQLHIPGLQVPTLTPNGTLLSDSSLQASAVRQLMPPPPLLKHDSINTQFQSGLANSFNFATSQTPNYFHNNPLGLTSTSLITFAPTETERPLLMSLSASNTEQLTLANCHSAANSVYNCYIPTSKGENSTERKTMASYPLSYLTPSTLLNENSFVNNEYLLPPMKRPRLSLPSIIPTSPQFLPLLSTDQLLTQQGIPFHPGPPAFNSALLQTPLATNTPIMNPNIFTQMYPFL